MNVHVVVPDLLWSPEAEQRAAPAERLDALERLLARGRLSMHPGVGLEAWLLGRFGVGKQHDWPAAPYSLAADGGVPESDWWLRADPVHIRVGRDSPSLADTAVFDLARDEAQALVASLNAHFAPDNLVFHPARPDRWYVRCARPSAVATTPTADARGRPLETLLPQGADAPRWHAVLNEVQMLLHEHPVNDAREARGALPVNSVWLWGGGTLVKPARTPYACVWSGDPVARGLALAAGARHEPVPGSARQWLDSAGAARVAAIVLDALRAPAAYGDIDTWRAALHSLERDWFAPLVDALRAGRVGMITLNAPSLRHTLEAETTRQDLRYFWRRSKPLGAYAQ